MGKNELLQAIMNMAQDDNKGVAMSIALVNAKKDPRGGIVSFGVEPRFLDDANLQLAGMDNKYMKMCFFIDRDELEKYKNSTPLIHAQSADSKRYLISKRFLSPKNKLEKMLQESLSKFDDTLISEDKLYLIPETFDSTYKVYKDNKGRVQITYDHSTMHGGGLWIRMGDSVILDLTLVKGEI